MTEDLDRRLEDAFGRASHRTWPATADAVGLGRVRAAVVEHRTRRRRLTTLCAVSAVAAVVAALVLVGLPDVGQRDHVGVVTWPGGRQPAPAPAPGGSPSPISAAPLVVPGAGQIRGPGVQPGVPTPTTAVAPAPKIAVPASTCSGSGWQLVDAGIHGAGIALSSVAAVSAADAWAVGTRPRANQANGQTLIEHWNGAAWSVVASPSPGGQSSVLNAVAAAGPNDVWAVGFSTDPKLALAGHWNGTTWSVVPTPAPGGVDNELDGLTVLSPTDVWAVGSKRAPQQPPPPQGAGGAPIWYDTLIEHWDGSAWSVVASPNPGHSQTLVGVAGSSSADVWAVGQSDAAPGGFLEHWNGSTWSVVPGGDQGASSGLLRGVTALSSTAVWVVGVAQDSNGTRPLIEHWNGSSWSVVPTPGLGDSTTAELYAVAAASGSSVWAVGEVSGSNWRRTLTERWDGSSWQVVSSLNQGPVDVLFGVAALPTGELWAVGVTGAYSQSANPTAGPLIERHCSGG